MNSLATPLEGKKCLDLNCKIYCSRFGELGRIDRVSRGLIFAGYELHWRLYKVKVVLLFIVAEKLTDIYLEGFQMERKYYIHDISIIRIKLNKVKVQFFSGKVLREINPWWATDNRLNIVLSLLLIFNRNCIMMFLIFKIMELLNICSTNYAKNKFHVIRC